MPKNHDDTSSQISSPTLPPPLPHTHIPARLSLDFHRDSDATGGGGSAFDMSSILSMVQRLDSRDGAGRNEGVGIGNSGVLVDRSTPASPLIVTNHWKGDLGTQLDGGTDRHWEHVSVKDSAGETRQERYDNSGMEGQKPDLSGEAPRSHSSSNHQQDYREEDIHPALRPGNQEESYSASGDFFRDFDGVHYTPEGATPPPLSVIAPPHTNHFNPEHSSHLHNSQLRPQQELRPISYASAGTSISESSRDSGFVYYPAPVPAVLNLPPLMAKDEKARNRLTKVQKRASQQVLSDVAAGDDKSGNRRSVVWGEGNDARTSPEAAEPDPVPPRKLDEQRLSKLPPALRASAFFDSMQSAGVHSVAPELKESSAVATLDSILDASANAPAAAFTDHPMTGTSSTSHLPMRNEYRNSVAMTVMLHPGESPRSSMDGGGNGEAQQQQLRNSHSFEVSTNNDTPPLGPGGETLPTTLLAELESRKQQQKSRTRTAASAFPSGIRSTLLELDAVAQVQARSRRQKRPHLAWEEPEEEGVEDDEDVPLGLLYHQGHVPRGTHRGGRDEDVPLGLLMQKEMEDAEPLSRRRERLRQQSGHSATPPPQIPQIPVLEVEDEVEEETLAQRMKRLKDTKTKEKRQSKFGDGSLELSFTPTAGSSTSTPPPEEETLAQRRKRLRDEEERRKLSVEAKAVQAEVKKRASMATILHGQHGGGIGLGGGMMGRSTPMLRPNTSGGGGGGGGGGGLVHQIGGSMLRPQMSMGNMHIGGNRGMGMGAGMPSMNGMMMPGGMTYGAMAMGGTAGGGVAPLTPQEIAMNNKQREMVERWRASVL
ncbi:hypothetical protein BDD12DRAFT_528513 [Trichophaea hybrida]|nr:hypothetical protein BDD12DRAFT_528513 [Trichophaea hybrida]